MSDSLQIIEKSHRYHDILGEDQQPGEAVALQLDRLVFVGRPAVTVQNGLHARARPPTRHRGPAYQPRSVNWKGHKNKKKLVMYLWYVCWNRPLT